MADLGEQLVEQQNGFKIKMKELEDYILHKLATAEGLTLSLADRSSCFFKVSAILGLFIIVEFAAQTMKE